MNMYEAENEPTNAVSTKTESSSAATRAGDTAHSLVRRAKEASSRRFLREDKDPHLGRRGARGSIAGGTVPPRGHSSHCITMGGRISWRRARSVCGETPNA